MLEGGCLGCCFDDVDALCVLDVEGFLGVGNGEGLEEIGYAKYDCRPREGFDKDCLGVEICGSDFDAFGSQGCGGVAGGTSSNPADSVGRLL